MEKHNNYNDPTKLENIDNEFTNMTKDLDKLPKMPRQENEINTVEDIINDLRYVTCDFPLAAIKGAIERQKEITPLLLNILNETVERYQSLENHDMEHLYSMYLLSQFREKAAFPLIITLASLPEDATDLIFGDSITEDLHKMIASVYDNNLTAIQQLIENPTICRWSRNAGIKTLLVLIKEGVLDRNQVIQYFKGLFTHPAFVDDENAMTHLVNACCDLYPAELYNEIKTVFYNNMVDTFSVDMQWVDSVLAMGEENALKRYLNDQWRYLKLQHFLKAFFRFSLISFFSQHFSVYLISEMPSVFV